MRILILSCNTGQGHNSAGMAVQEELERRGIPCEMKDALSFAKGNSSRTISGAYIRIATKAPAVFGGIYGLGDLISSSRWKSPVYYANTRYAQPLKNYIEAGGFTAVVTPHLFPAETLTCLRRGGFSIPCYAIATDYTCIPFWEETELDGYFLPHEDLVPEFEHKKLPREKLIPTGLPVSGRYLESVDRQKARERLGLPTDVPVFLVMTGSMGFGNVLSLSKSLLLACPKNAEILILTGNNETLKAQIDRDFAGENRVTTIPFTRDVPLYMAACDVLLTKPGGLTSTEAAVLGVPLVHTRPIPGCETKNARFFSSRGLSLFAEKPTEAAAAAVRLAADHGLQEQICRRQRETIPHNAAGAIAAFLEAKDRHSTT